MHIFDAAKLTLERRRKNNDRYLRPFFAQSTGDLSPKLTGAEMVVEYRYIGFVQMSLSLFDGCGLDCLVAMFTQDRRPQDEIIDVIVEEKHTDRSSLDYWLFFVHDREGLSRPIHSSYLPQQSWMRAPG